VDYLGRTANYIDATEFMNPSQRARKFDFVLSECAFNECNEDVQRVYLKKIINHSTHGRLCMNDSMRYAEVGLKVLLTKDVFEMLPFESKKIEGSIITW
jgi:hypothetical protein